jgi:enoyl-CoA hydratase/carnithine racemase
MMRDACFSMHHGSTLALSLTSPLLKRPRVMSICSEMSDARLQRHLQSVLLMGAEDGGFGVCGSDMVEIARMDADGRGKHYQELFNLVSALGDDRAGSAPAVVALDGVLCGAAVGAALHAPFFVVTEKTRLWLPGPVFGCPGESLALHRLSRLPHAIGRYVALAGASLSGVECVSLGLATHLTESHALPRLTDALAEGFPANAAPASGDPFGRISRRLQEACVDPPPLAGWGPEHALFYAAQIEETFGRDTLPEILAAVEGGASDWHAAALDAMRSASPLALCLTFAQLQAAQSASCWADAARAEAESCAAAGATADFAAGASSLQKAKAAARTDLKAQASRGRNRKGAREIARNARASAAARAAAEEEASAGGPVWEHASVEAVPAELVERLARPMA